MGSITQEARLAYQREPAVVPIGKESLNRWAGPFVRPSASGRSAVAKLEISLFGGLWAQFPMGRGVALPGRKDCALLGYLAVSPGVPFPREKLATLLWGDSGDRQARDSLKQALLRLRRALGPRDRAARRRPSRGQPAARPSRSTSRASSGCCATGRPKRSSARSSSIAATCSTACASAARPSRTGCSSSGSACASWRSRRPGRSMAQALAAGARDRAAVAAQRLLAFDPLHEGACRALMTIHAERGERTQALKLYETLRAGSGTSSSACRRSRRRRALHEQIRRERRAAPAGAAPASLRR